MNTMQLVNLFVKLLVIVGAVNWGLVAYNGTDVVKMVTGGGDPERYTKIAVGLSGVYFAFLFYTHMTKV